MTWKHGILQDPYEAGLRGRLLMFVSSFYLILFLV